MRKVERMIWLENISMESIAERVKKRREELGLSYGELSKLTGIPKSSLFRYESGDIKNIPSGKLAILAAALDTTPEHLIGWDIEKPAPDETGELRIKLFDIVKNLPPEDLKKLLDYAEAFEALQRARLGK